MDMHLFENHALDFSLSFKKFGTRNVGINLLSNLKKKRYKLINLRNYTYCS